MLRSGPFPHLGTEHRRKYPTPISITDMVSLRQAESLHFSSLSIYSSAHWFATSKSFEHSWGPLSDLRCDTLPYKNFSYVACRPSCVYTVSFSTGTSHLTVQPLQFRCQRYSFVHRPSVAVFFSLSRTCGLPTQQWCQSFLHVQLLV